MSYIVRNEQLRGDISSASLTFALTNVHRAGANELRYFHTVVCSAEGSKMWIMWKDDVK